MLFSSRETVDAILNFLYDHMAKSADLQARLHWTPNTIAIWDNRITAHVRFWMFSFLLGLLIRAFRALSLTTQSRVKGDTEPELRLRQNALSRH